MADLSNSSFDELMKKKAAFDEGIFDEPEPASKPSATEHYWNQPEDVRPDYEDNAGKAARARAIEEGVTAGDFGRSIQATAGGMVEGLGKIAENTIGLGETGQTVGRAVRENAEDNMSPRMLQARQRKLIDEDAAGNLSFGDAWADPVALTDTVLQGMVSLIPMAGTSITAARIAGAAAAKVALKEVAAKGLSGVAAKEFVTAATQQAAKRAAMLAGGATEGALEAGGAGVEVGRKVRAMAHEQLMEGSAEYRALIESEVSPEDAREQIATAAENEAMLTVGPSAAVLGSVPGRLIGGAVSHSLPNALSGGLVKRTALGAAGGALEEGAQGGSGQALQNIAVRSHANSSQRLGEGVANAAAQEAVGGAGMGGLFGAMNQSAPPPPAAPLPTNRPNSPLSNAANAGQNAINAAAVPVQSQILAQEEAGPGAEPGSDYDTAYQNVLQREMMARQQLAAGPATLPDDAAQDELAAPSAQPIDAFADVPNKAPVTPSTSLNTSQRELRQQEQAPGQDFATPQDAYAEQQRRAEAADVNEFDGLVSQERADQAQRLADLKAQVQSRRAERAQQALAGDEEQDAIAAAQPIDRPAAAPAAPTAPAQAELVPAVAPAAAQPAGSPIKLTSATWKTAAKSPQSVADAELDAAYQEGVEALFDVEGNPLPAEQIDMNTELEFYAIAGERKRRTTPPTTPSETADANARPVPAAASAPSAAPQVDQPAGGVGDAQPGSQSGALGSGVDQPAAGTAPGGANAVPARRGNAKTRPVKQPKWASDRNLNVGDSFDFNLPNDYATGRMTIDGIDMASVSVKDANGSGTVLPYKKLLAAMDAGTAARVANATQTPVDEPAPSAPEASPQAAPDKGAEGVDKTPAEKSVDGARPLTELEQAQADKDAALADLGAFFRNTGLTNQVIPEADIPKLIPVLTRLVDATFRLGYHSFKASVRETLRLIRENFGDAAADALTIDHLQGAYIAGVGSRAEATPKKEVVAFDSIEEVLRQEAQSTNEAVPEIKSDLDAKAHEAATSPLNNTPPPTDEQKSAGNYKLGHVRVQGLGVSIENPRGSIRSGTSPDGKRWENTLAHHYGYFKGSKAGDGDNVDVFLTDGAEEAKTAWVIDQKNQDGSFDELKVVLGPDSESDARQAYLANYAAGWEGIGAITSMPMEAFKAWVMDGKVKRKPLAYVVPVQSDTADEGADIAALSDAQINGVFQRLGLAGDKASVAEKRSMLLAEDPAEVRAAIAAVVSQETPAGNTQAALPVADETQDQPTASRPIAESIEQGKAGVVIQGNPDELAEADKLNERIVWLREQLKAAAEQNSSQKPEGNAASVAVEGFTALTGGNEWVKTVQDGARKHQFNIRRGEGDREFFIVKYSLTFAGGFTGAPSSLVGTFDTMDEATKAVKASMSRMDIAPDTTSAEPVAETTESEQDDANTYTEAEAIQRMSWRDMGTEKGTKTFHLEFFGEDGNPETGRGAMKHAYIEQSLGKGGDKKYRVYSRGGDYLGTAHATLQPAKAEGIRASLESVRSEGYIKDAINPAPAQTKAKAAPQTETAKEMVKALKNAGYPLAGEVSSSYRPEVRLTVNADDKHARFDLTIERKDGAWTVQEFTVPDFTMEAEVDGMKRFRADLAKLNAGQWPDLQKNDDNATSFKPGDTVRLVESKDSKVLTVDSVGPDGWIYTKSGEANTPDKFEHAAPKRDIDGGFGIGLPSTPSFSDNVRSWNAKAGIGSNATPGQDEERFERAMRAAATDKPTTGKDGYVQTTALRYVAMVDALKIARDAVAAGVRPVPAQFHTRLDLTMGSADRLIAAVKESTAGQSSGAAEPGRMNMRHTIKVADILTPAGAIKADARSGKGSVWYHQGDPQHIQFAAKVTFSGQPAPADAIARWESLSKAQDLGYRLHNYKAGSLGTAWILEKDGKALTRDGYDAVTRPEFDKPVRETTGAGYDNMVSGQSTYATKLAQWFATLPESTLRSASALATKMRQTPIGEWASIQRDRMGDVRMDFEDASGKLDLHMFSSGEYQEQVRRIVTLAGEAKNKGEREWFQVASAAGERADAAIKEDVDVRDLLTEYGFIKDADLSHLHALETRLSNERARLNTMKTDGERAQREVLVKQIEKEIAGERKFLGMPDSEASDLSDDEILAELGATAESSSEAKEARAPRQYATMADIDSAIEAFYDGTASPADYKAAFRGFMSNKESIAGELNKQTKDQLVSRFGKKLYGGAETKPEIVARALESIQDAFALRRTFGRNSWTMGPGSFEKYQADNLAALTKLVEESTAEDLKAFADEIAQTRAARQEKLEGAQDPKTIEDFDIALRLKMAEGVKFAEARMSLTPEQRAEYDRLKGIKSRDERKARADQQKTAVKVAGQTTGGMIVEGKHTKHGYPLWIVQPAERVDGDSFTDLVTNAKRMGGNYVNMRQANMWRTQWGYQFQDQAKAEAFLKLLGGDSTEAKDVIQERRDAFADDKSQSAVERLNEMAERMEEKADESLGRERKANTARRARFAASAESAANSEKAMATTMRRIASAIESGAAQFLDRVRQKTQIEYLSSTLRTALYEEAKAKFPGDYGRQQKYMDEQRYRQTSKETADYAVFPQYTMMRSDLASLARRLITLPNMKLLGQRILKVADDTSDAYTKFAKEHLLEVSKFGSVERGGWAEFSTLKDAERSIEVSNLADVAVPLQVKRGAYRIVLSSSEAIKRGIWKGDDKPITLNEETGSEIVEKLGKLNRRLGKRTGMDAPPSAPWQFENAYNDRKRLAGLGIEQPWEFRAALREFAGLKEAPQEADKIKAMERAMVGRKNDGLDFFPTSAAVVEQMLEAADLQEGMNVLEPSAGMGHIAEGIREVGVDPDVVEMASDRRDLLEAKGFNVVGSDFMDLSPRGFTYGDVFEHQDGRQGVMRGSGGMGSNRVGFIPEGKTARESEWVDREDLTGAEKRGSDSGYDRIVMNPPYSDRRDALHVQHAYSLLRPGGRLVALMGEGVFFGQDKKAEAFRNWLEEVGGSEERLPEGSFMDPALPVNTGANARLVVIDRPVDDVSGKESRNPDDPDPTEATRVQQGIEGKDILGAAAWIANNAPSEAQALIAGKVLASLQKQRDLGVKFEFVVAHPDESVPIELYQARGVAQYNVTRDGKWVSVWVNGTDVDGKVGTSFDTVTHELVHAATAGAIDLVIEKKTNDPRLIRSVADLSRVFAAVANHINQREAEFHQGKVELTPFEQTTLKDGNNFLKNEHELLAWAFSNIEAQQYLASIPYGNRTLWSAFVDAVRRALGLDSNQNTALDEVLRAGEEILLNEAFPRVGLSDINSVKKTSQRGVSPRSSRSFYYSDTDAKRVQAVTDMLNEGKESRGSYSAGLPVAEVSRSIATFRSFFPGADQLDIRAVATRADLPNGVRASPRAEGVYLDGRGQVFLIAANLQNQDRVFTVITHEIIGHYGLEAMGEKYAQIKQTVLMRATATGKTTGREVPGDANYATVESVRQAYTDYSRGEPIIPHPDVVAAEVLARMSEVMQHPTWYRAIVAKVRQWLKALAQRFGINLDPSLKDAEDLIQIAAARLRKPGNGGPQGGRREMAMAESRESRGEQQSSLDFAAEFLNELSFEDEAFRFPISASKSIAGNVLDAMPGAEHLRRETVPDEDNDAKADFREVFANANGRIFYVYQRGNEAWIDVSRFQPKDVGSAIYHAMANYAYNTGKTFIGDPMGLSEDAMIRRTPAMLSSALRFGTTQHIAPAREQLQGAPEKGIEPLVWRDGDDIANLKALIHTYLSTLHQKFPDLQDYRYDFNRLQFVDRRGRPVDSARLERGAGTGPARAARSGTASLRRGILLQSLVAAESSERPAILEQVLSRSAQLAAEDGGLKGVFSLGDGASNLTHWLNHPSDGAKAATGSIKDWLKAQFTQRRPFMMGFLTVDQIADIYGAKMASVKDFANIVQAMDTEKQKIADEADQVVEKWRQLDSAVADQVADLMHEATLMQFDPDHYSPPRDHLDPSKVDLFKRYDALPEAARTVYREARDGYKQTIIKVRDALEKRVDRAGTMGGRIAAEIRLQFDKYLEEGPYFPLARFGDFVLISDNGKPDGRIVEAFESVSEREKAKAARIVEGYEPSQIKETSKQAYSQAKDGAAGQFAMDVIKHVQAMDMDDAAKSSLLDDLNQIAITNLPDQSYRKHFVHRKGVPGFSNDAMRAFANSQFHAAHHIAKINHADQLSFKIDEIMKEARDARSGDVTEPIQVANELKKRLDTIVNPTTGPVAAALGQFGFVMSLGGNIASGVTNLTQTPMVTYPWLGAKFGFDKAAVAMTKASKDYFGGKWNKWSGYVLHDNPSLTDLERQALHRLQDMGKIDMTQAHDLAGVANQNSAQSKGAYARSRAMKIVGWTFHLPEVFNRQVSALAAYRLAIDSGMAHGAAIQYAGKTLDRTHFNYKSTNRARFMQGDFMRVLTMFKQYSQQMTYVLWRNAYQALKGESPEVRREARRMLAGLLTMHFMAAGSLGLPLGAFGVSTILLPILGMGMGDDDDPWDWQVEYRKMLSDTFGTKGGEVIAHGPLRAVMPYADFASRVGLGDLWFRAPGKEMEGRAEVEAWMQTLAGPVVGYAGNIGTAAKLMNEGNFQRGVEAMMPKMIAAPLKAIRFGTDGVQSMKGDDLGISIDAIDVAFTASGFNPSDVSEMYESRNAVKNREHLLDMRRKQIINQWHQSRKAGDNDGIAEALKRAEAFNTANKDVKSLQITKGTLAKSAAAKERSASQVKVGAYLSKGREQLREEGRFADVDAE